MHIFIMINLTFPPVKLSGSDPMKYLDGLFYLNYLNSIKQGLNHIEGEYIIENTLKLCERERNIKRDTKELQESVKEKYDWLEKYILS